MVTRERCPYLSLAGKQQSALPARRSEYRCHAQVLPERVGGVYQSAICLTEAHRRCPTLAAYPLHRDAPTSLPEQPAPGHGPSRRAGLAEVVPLPRPPSLTSRMRGQIAGAFRTLDAQLAQPATSAAVRPSQLQDAAEREAKVLQSKSPQEQVRPQQELASTPQRLTLTEFLVGGLGFSILATILALYLAVFVYRSEVTFALGKTPVSTEVPRTVVANLEASPIAVPVASQPPAVQAPTTSARLLSNPIPTRTPPEPPATNTPVASPTPLPPTPRPSITPTPTPSPSPTATPTPVRPPAQSPPTRLTIPKLKMDVPIKPVGYKSVKVQGKSQVVWDTLPNVGCFHQASALPGHPGNTVINGHRDIGGSVFYHLDKVKVGDKIVLYVGEVAYPYRVAEIRVNPYVEATAEDKAENLWLISNIPEERLTLVTCTPVGVASHRLYIVAKPPVHQMDREPDNPIVR